MGVRRWPQRSTLPCLTNKYQRYYRLVFHTYHVLSRTYYLLLTAYYSLQRKVWGEDVILQSEHLRTRAIGKAMNYLELFQVMPALADLLPAPIAHRSSHTPPLAEPRCPRCPSLPPLPLSAPLCPSLPLSEVLPKPSTA